MHNYYPTGVNRRYFTACVRAIGKGDLLISVLPLEV